MDNLCPHCKSKSIMVSVTGCHCLECGTHFDSGQALNFFML